MIAQMIASGIAVGLVLIIVGLVVWRRRPRRIKTDKVVQDWRELQTMCRDKANWKTVVVKADELLDKTLKRRRFKGKTMGERLVSAQRKFTNNDDVWFAHNLAKKLLGDDTKRLKESEVKEALIGFRQALRDLGALPTTQAEATDTKGKA